MKTCILIACLFVLVAVAVAQKPGEGTGKKDGDRVIHGDKNNRGQRAREACSVEDCSTTDPLSEDVDGTTLCCDSSKYTSIKVKAAEEQGDDAAGGSNCYCQKKRKSGCSSPDYNGICLDF